jgi:hypothetical protein
MRNAPPLTGTGPVDSEQHSLIEVVPDEAVPEERTATVWVSRITFVVGAAFLMLALLAWLFRHGHNRLVLALLIVALVASILHSYTFENGGQV